MGIASARGMNSGTIHPHSCKWPIRESMKQIKVTLLPIHWGMKLLLISAVLWRILSGTCSSILQVCSVSSQTV